jgi:hypothetical protein
LVRLFLYLIGITYDPGDDLVKVALEGLDHMIRRPRDIYVEIGAGTLATSRRKIPMPSWREFGSRAA